MKDEYDIPYINTPFNENDWVFGRGANREKPPWPGKPPPRKDPPRPIPRQSAWDVLWLKPGAPKEVIKAAFRALSKTRHPDNGGSNAAMRQLTEAYTELMKGIE